MFGRQCTVTSPQFNRITSPAPSIGWSKKDRDGHRFEIPKDSRFGDHPGSGATNPRARTAPLMCERTQSAVSSSHRSEACMGSKIGTSNRSDRRDKFGSRTGKELVGED